MKKVEIIIAIIVIIGLVLKYFHIPGGSLVLLLGLMTLSFIYFYASFAYFNGVSIRSVVKKQGGKKLKPFAAVSAFFFGWGLSILIIGILFYIQIWPGFRVMLLTGLIVTIVGAIAFLIARKDKFLQTILRTVLIGGLGLFLYLFPIMKYIDFVHKDNPEYAEKLKKVYANPDNMTYRKELEDYRKSMTKKGKTQ